MAIKKTVNQEDERSRTVIAQYSERLGYLRKAQEFSQRDETVNAVICYKKYLKALANWYKTSEENLSPRYFNLKKDAPELLLISQVYWDLSKAYDRNPKLENESIRCLNQFKKFTLGLKYQYINSEMLRKFIKRSKCHHPKNFENAYKEIKMGSKNCYVATHCYGSEHQITSLLRQWKNKIILTKMGQQFVDYYYRFSPLLIAICERHPKMGKFLTVILFRPFLQLFSKFIKVFILA